MFVFANLLNSFAHILQYILTIYMYLIIIRALLTWVNPDPYNPIVRFLYNVTEPVLYQVRKRLPHIGGVDISPIIVILIIWFLQGFVVQSISDIAFRMKMGG